MAQLKRKRKNSFWQEFYKHLMTGISYMIPVLIMGGLIGAFSQVIPYVIFKIDPSVSILHYLVLLFQCLQHLWQTL